MGMGQSVALKQKPVQLPQQTLFYGPVCTSGGYANRTDGKHARREDTIEQAAEFWSTTRPQRS